MSFVEKIEIIIRTSIKIKNKINLLEQQAQRINP